MRDGRSASDWTPRTVAGLLEGRAGSLMDVCRRWRFGGGCTGHLLICLLDGPCAARAEAVRVPNGLTGQLTKCWLPSGSGCRTHAALYVGMYLDLYHNTRLRW